MTDAVAFRLQRGATWRRLNGGRVVVFLPRRMSPVSLSGPVEQILPLLAEGCTVDDLHKALTQSTDQRVDRQQIMLLLARLREVGVLDPPGAEGRSRLRWLFDVGRVVERCRIERAGPAIAAGFPAAVALALVVLVIAAFAGVLRNPLTVIFALDWAPFALVLLVLAPLHEFGHALAAVATRTPLGRFGVSIRRLLIRPCVETLPVKTLDADRRKAIVAAGGPAMDLVSAGGSSLIALLDRGAGGATAGALAVLAVILCLRNLSPGPRKDGFKVLCGLFGWVVGPREPHRRGPGLSRAAAVSHRRISAAYNLGFLILIIVMVVDVARV